MMERASLHGDGILKEKNHDETRLRQLPRQRPDRAVHPHDDMDSESGKPDDDVGRVPDPVDPGGVSVTGGEEVKELAKKILSEKGHCGLDGSFFQERFNKDARTLAEYVLKQAGSDTALDKKLSHLRTCILDGSHEDAQEHIFELLRGLRCSSIPDCDLTPSGVKSKSLWKSDRS